MAYQPWLASVNYPVDSIVTYEGVPYQATRYHLLTNNDPPNVEIRTIETLYGAQRGWTVYQKPQPPGSFGGVQIAAIGLPTKRPFDPDDDWNGSLSPDNELQEGPYGVGVSSVEFQGTNNSPTLQCPKGDCHVFFDGGGVYYGFVSNNSLVTITNPVLVTLPSGQTYYVSGPETSSNTMYVFFTHTAAWAVKRTFEFTMETYNDPEPEIEIRTVTGQEKFYVQTPIFPYVQPYPPFTAFDTPYYAPGNEAFQVTYGEGGVGQPLSIKLTNIY